MHYFNKKIVPVFQLNWIPYTRNIHWNENVIRHLTSQSLVWRSVRTARTISWFSAYLWLKYFFNVFYERERERERERELWNVYFFVCQAYWNVQVIFFQGFSENRLVVNTVLIRACIVREVVNGYLVWNVIYDLSVIFNDFTLPSRAIFKDIRRKVYLQMKVEMLTDQKDLIFVYER